MAVIGVKSITGITSITNAAGGADVLTFHSNNTTERLRIASDGNVAIGNASPQQLLHVWPDTANTTSAYVRVTAGDRNSNTGIDVGHDASGNGHVNVVSNGTLTFSTLNAGRIKIANSSAATSIGGAMTFNAMLTTQGDVSGGLLMLKAAENTTRLFVSGNDTNGCEVNLYDNAGGQRGILGVSSTDFFIKAPNSSAPMTFWTHNGSALAERLRIDSSGHMGLGVAPNANWPTNGDFKALQLGTGIAVFGRGSGDEDRGGISANYYHTGSAQKYIGNGHAGRMYFEDGSIVFSNAAQNSSGANAALTLNERLRIQSDGNVGIARTINNYKTSNTSSLYNLSVNRESNQNNTGGLNKSLNVDNQYAVSTFRSTNTNRNGTQAWFDIAHFRSWDINATVIIQAGGTFTGDQVEIKVISSYNSALNNGRSGPYLEVKSTQAHTGQRFTKVKLGCHNSNRQPILQVYFDGNATHNALGTVNVTVHDYGTNYGCGEHRGEPKFATATTLNETWKEVTIKDTNFDWGTIISEPQGTQFASGYVTTPQNPKFWYSSLSNASTSSATNSTEILKFATERHNQGSNYNASNGRFTAPVAGTYWFSFNGLVDNSGSSSHYWAQLWRNGSQVTSIGYTYSNSGEYEQLGGSACIYLAKNDYAEIYASANIHVGNETSFSGFLIG